MILIDMFTTFFNLILPALSLTVVALSLIVGIVKLLHTFAERRRTRLRARIEARKQLLLTRKDD